MAEPFIGEIRLFGGNFAPVNWAFCNGTLLSIAQFQVLFALIGTTYGGDGQSNFALPDLRSRVPVHQGTGGGATYVIGQAGGAETVTLLSTQLPSHSHQVAAAGGGTANIPAGSVILSNQTEPSGGTPAPAYAAPNAATLTPLAPQTIANNAGGQPHDNMQPFLTLNYIIALAGIFPSQS
jgi:microcystin-dependent protein